MGYGDISVLTNTELILSVIWMIFGVGFYSFTIGNLSSVLASMDNKSAILKQKLLTLSDYSRKIAMPKELDRGLGTALAGAGSIFEERGCQPHSWEHNNLC